MLDSTRPVTLLVAVVAVVGMSVAPVAATAGDGVTETNGTDTGQQADHGPFPHEVCTDLLEMVHSELPYDQVVWIDDLPDDLQPPGVPWNVITLSAVAGIVVGATPNQCDIQDPNDPSWNPAEDNVDPDGGVDFQEGDEVLVIVNGTLDQTSEGPSARGKLGFTPAERGHVDPEIGVNDGEKEYALDPRVEYWDDGTTYFETDVYVFGSRLGVQMDCFGEECNPGLRGLPTFVEPPALPSHSDTERPTEDTGDGADGNETDDDAEDGPGADEDDEDDSSGAGGGGGASDADSGGGDGGGDGNDGSDGADTDDGDGEADSGGGDDGEGEETDDGSGDGESEGETDDTPAETAEETDGETDDADQQQQVDESQQAIAAQGSGLGVVVALVVLLLGAAALAPRE